MQYDFQELRVQHVGLESVHDCAFCGLRRLVMLDLSFNKLKRLPELGPLKLTLEDLRLSGNNISRFDSGYFYGFKMLRLVYLNNNRVQSVPCLTSLQTTLHKLRLDNNEIKNLDGIYNSGTLLSLKRLTLSGNNIASFNVSGLLNMPNLSYLSLMRNNLATLPDLRPYFKGMMFLGVNPWHCDPSISWMPSMTTIISKIGCVSPPCLRGNDIKHMSNTNSSQYVAVNFPSNSYRRPILHVWWFGMCVVYTDFFYQCFNLLVAIMHAYRIISNRIISYLLYKKTNEEHWFA